MPIHSSESVSRLVRAISVLSLVTGLALAPAALTGCEKKKPVAVAPPPPPPPPPAPEKISVDPVLQSMKPDARVSFPESSAPYSESLARAVITLADALAKGDATAMRARLAPDDQQVLDTLVGSGEWEESVAKIKGVRVVSLMHADPEGPTAIVGLAVQEQGEAYLLGFAGVKESDAWTFTAVPAPGETRARASDFDGATVGVAFSGSFIPEAAPASNDPSLAPDEEAPDDAPADAPGSTGPRRKNTPSGPVTIPGSGSGR